MSNFKIKNQISNDLRIMDDLIRDVDGVIWEVRPRLICHGDLEGLRDAENAKGSK